MHKENKEQNPDSGFSEAEKATAVSGPYPGLVNIRFL